MNPTPGADGEAIGRYEILGELGSGAMATVHLARQLDLDRSVALKELHRIGVAESAVTASRFLREARLAGSLSHANIVTVYEYFEYDGRPYIAMEFVSGGSLRERLESLSLGQILGVLDGLLSALTHAEAHRIVHRDIKPENILVTADGRIKITDFGIAKAYTLTSGESLTATGTAVGTPMYMAPEQVTGKQLTIATDLYAVGIVAFEMLFGYVPFGSGDTPHAILWQQVNEPLPDARGLRPDLDLGLARWLENLLAKDPADRPASAAQALEALEEIALELLGNRWRREAPLPPRAAEVAGGRMTAPPAPRSQASAAAASHPIAAANAPEELAGTRDAGASAIRPPTPPEQTEHYGRPQRDLPVADAPVATSARWTVKGAAIVALASLAAAGGGYLVFDSGKPQDDRPSATARGFADALDRTMQRFKATRVRTRQQLQDAGTAREQAAHARELAAAYGQATAALEQLEPAPEQRAAAARLGEQLARGRKAYMALARAATAHREKAYDEQSVAVDTQDKAALSAADKLLAAR
jgi:tRNA A-37 threonylcarbamoyl transferase component Bud32